VVVEDDVLAAVHSRARALAQQDDSALRQLLHPAFVWTSHTGDVFDRDAYIRANTRGPTRWHGQRFEDPVVIVVGCTAVMCCMAIDDVDTGGGRRDHRMPMTQTWVLERGRWRCLAGHAGPRM
jgi:alpha-D-ribose 1-methylphosphonate 5-triphosphate diphosphatase PhnM